MKKIIEWLNWIGYKSGIKTYHLHGIIAMLITICFSFLTLAVSYGIAVGFYAGREYRDYEKLGTSDIREFVYPLVYATTTFIVLGLING